MPKRVPQSLHKIPLRVVGQLKVKAPGASGSKEKLAGICLFELQQIFHCLKTYNYNEEACSKEIGNFQKCYDTHVANYVSKSSESEKSKTAQLKELFNRFPERTKKRS